MSFLIANESLKKKSLLALLIASCLVTSALLVFPQPQRQILTDLELVDTIISRELSRHGIDSQSLRSQHIEVNESFTRITYRTTLPPGVSATCIHADLSRSLQPWNIRITGYVDVPAGRTTLYIRYNGKVIRMLAMNST